MPGRIIASRSSESNHFFHRNIRYTFNKPGLNIEGMDMANYEGFCFATSTPPQLQGLDCCARAVVDCSRGAVVFGCIYTCIFQESPIQHHCTSLKTSPERRVMDTS